MSNYFLILFYSTSLTFFLIAYFLYSRYKNNSTAKAVEKFDAIIYKYKPYFQKDIKIDFMTDNLGKYIIQSQILLLQGEGFNVNSTNQILPTNIAC